MARYTHTGTLMLVLLAAWIGLAEAADHVVGGTQLRLRRTATAGTMTLVLRDVSAIPTPGSADDPSLAGVTVTLFGRGSGEQATFTAPAGRGRPGWNVRSAPRVTYTYVNPKVPPGNTSLQRAALRDGAGLRIRGRSAGLSLTSGEGAIAVRVQWGSERVCTLFDGAAVRNDGPGRFNAMKAGTPPFTDCDDATLAGGPPPTPCSDDGISCTGDCPGDSVCAGNPFIGCTCVSPHQPCGDSAPACNGECPAGEVCGVTTGGPWPGCGCVPAASTPCGDAHPSCDVGACPVGTSCYVHWLDTFPATIDYCACASEPPVGPCGGTCPPGWTCVGPRPGLPATCLPPFCDGGNGFPTCDGTCGPNATCTALGACFCIEHCSGGSPFPTCGGTCTTPNTTCIAINDQCLCG